MLGKEYLSLSYSTISYVVYLSVSLFEMLKLPPQKKKKKD